MAEVAGRGPGRERRPPFVRQTPAQRAPRCVAIPARPAQEVRQHATVGLRVVQRHGPRHRERAAAARRHRRPACEGHGRLRYDVQRRPRVVGPVAVPLYAGQRLQLLGGRHQPRRAVAVLARRGGPPEHEAPRALVVLDADWGRWSVSAAPRSQKGYSPQAIANRASARMGSVSCWECRRVCGRNRQTGRRRSDGYATRKCIAERPPTSHLAQRGRICDDEVSHGHRGQSRVNLRMCMCTGMHILEKMETQNGNGIRTKRMHTTTEENPVGM